ncbi:MAG: coenzyme F420 hydrogenase/dehydrogenase beta subunit N-terminal domain-containing protein [Euryarchaeota archaeon]|nr:coenzyme F420 hydrogenase/dehydrogenase beta subunit N-terminal domain-containing protein [Euryarchaeota archaeon]
MSNVKRDGTAFIVVDAQNFMVDEKGLVADWGVWKRAVAAKVSDERIHEKAQDGGVVTAILLYLLEAQLIDGAILTGKEEDGMPIPMVATSKEEIISAAVQNMGHRLTC